MPCYHRANIVRCAVSYVQSAGLTAPSTSMAEVVRVALLVLLSSPSSDGPTALANLRGVHSRLSRSNSATSPVSPNVGTHTNRDLKQEKVAEKKRGSSAGKEKYYWLGYVWVGFGWKGPGDDIPFCVKVLAACILSNDKQHPAVQYSIHNDSMDEKRCTQRYTTLFCVYVVQCAKR